MTVGTSVLGTMQEFEVKNDREIARLNWLHYARARDAGHLKYVADAQHFDRVYLGDQWDADLRRKLDSEGKPTLTLNVTMSAVNAALGEHSAQRADIVAKPRLDATEETARVMTHVIDQILDNNKYQAVEQMVFADGLIQDRGFFDVRMDFEDNLLGEVRIRSLDPVDVLIDPDAKEYDPATWNEVMYTRWHTVEEIGVLYGKEKADLLMTLARGGMTLGYDSVRLDVKESRYGDTQYPIYITDDYQSVVRNVRVIERQSRVLTKVTQFVDLQTGDTREVPENWDKARIKAVAQQYGLGIRKAFARKIRWTVTADWVVLSDDWSPYDRFTIVPYFPAFRRGKSSGMVRQLVSPQEQLNKVESQTLHVVNTTANSGWMFEEGSLANMTAQELEERGAETGLVLEYRKGREAPQKIQPNSIPTGLDRIGTKAVNFVREISGVASLMGIVPGGDVSGVALEKTQGRALTLLQVAFDNLNFTRGLVAQSIIACVQRFYNEPRILRVTDWRQPEQPEMELPVNQVSVSGEILNNLQMGEYEVIVSSAPARDGIQETQFAEVVQLRQAGVLVPDEYVIRASHLAHKNEIADQVKQLQGRGDPSTEEAQMAQAQQQMNLQMMQLQLAQLEAEVQKMQSEAVLNQAKAQAAVVDAQVNAQSTQSDVQLSIEKIKADIAKTQANLTNKLALADKHIAAKHEGAAFTAGERRRDADLKAGLEIEKIASTERTKKAAPKTKG
jgi:hypothetical protein